MILLNLTDSSASGMARDGIICAVAAVCFCCPVSCDNWNYNSSNPCLYVGGNYNQNQNHGLFYVNYNSTTNKNANHGSRHLALFATKSSLRSFRLQFGTDSRAPHGGNKQMRSGLVPAANQAARGESSYCN